MRRVLLTCLLWAGALAVLPAPGWAQDSSGDAIDREIIERLDRIETRLDGLDTRLVRVETRLDESMRRLEGSITQLHHRLNDLRSIFIGVISVIGVIIAALIAALISVVIRDRKTTPPSSQPERDSLENIRAALHALAQRDENVAAVLKQFNL